MYRSLYNYFSSSTSTFQHNSQSRTFQKEIQVFRFNMDFVGNLATSRPFVIQIEFLPNLNWLFFSFSGQILNHHGFKSSAVSFRCVELQRTVTRVFRIFRHRFLVHFLRNKKLGDVTTNRPTWFLLDFCYQQYQLNRSHQSKHIKFEVQVALSRLTVIFLFLEDLQ